jgi:ABC-2 type transport system permease protein
MKLRPYAMITRNSVMANLAYRAHFFFFMIGTAIYVAVSYFLWKAIYAGGGSIGGLSFEQAYLTIGISMSLYGLLQSWTEWYMHNTVTEGDLIRFLCKPLDYPSQLLFDVLGSTSINLVAITLPSMAIAYALSGARLPSVSSVLLFAAAVVLGFLINFFIDFLVGLSVFVTHSIWGIATAKEVTVLFLSGAVVPLAFFPDRIRVVLEWLPFQAIYYTPVRLLIDPSLGASEIAWFFLKQVVWLLCFFGLGRLLFRAALRSVVVNGG